MIKMTNPIDKLARKLNNERCTGCKHYGKEIKTSGGSLVHCNKLDELICWGGLWFYIKGRIRRCKEKN
jgi:hypothetical protein